MTSTDSDVDVEPKYQRSEHLGYLEDADKGLYNVSIASSNRAYTTDKENLEGNRSLCDRCEAATCLESGMTNVQACAFQHECECVWKDKYDADLTEDVCSEGLLSPENGQGRIERFLEQISSVVDPKD